MNFVRQRCSKRAAAAALLLSILAAFPAPVALSQAPAATADGAIQQDGAQQKPIPQNWKIAIVASAVVLSLVVLAFAVRAWRASNLFDREYRLPPVASVALRLGANRSGGCMATIKFRDRGDPINRSG